MELNESVIDPIKETRNPDLFIGPDYEVIKTKIKNQILDIIYKWLKKMGYDYEEVVKEIKIMGSSIGFQYGDTSDIDVSVITSIPDSKLNDLIKILPNGNNAEGTTMPINYYMLKSGEADVDKDTSDIYDLLNDKWVKKTSREEIKKTNKIPFSYVIEIAKFFTSGVDDRINEYEADLTELEYLKKISKEDIEEEEKNILIAQKENEIKSDLDSLYVAHCMLRSLRHQAYGTRGKDDGWYPIPIIIELKDSEKFDDPNNSVSNRVYKMIEKLGYFDKLEKYEKERDKLLTKK